MTHSIFILLLSHSILFYCVVSLKICTAHARCIMRMRKVTDVRMAENRSYNSDPHKKF
jgi:hypothetical protein